MFVYYFVHVDLPFDVVERRLLDRLDAMDELANASYSGAETLRSGFAGTCAGERLVVTTGSPSRSENETHVPIWWGTTGEAKLPQALEAEIVVAPLDANLTQVSIRGSYRAPVTLKPLGKAQFHRITEATVKGFIDAVGAAVEHGDDLERTG